MAEEKIDISDNVGIKVNGKSVKEEAPTPEMDLEKVTIPVQVTMFKNIKETLELGCAKSGVKFDEAVSSLFYTGFYIESTDPGWKQRVLEAMNRRQQLGEIDKSFKKRKAAQRKKRIKAQKDARKANRG